MGLDPSPPPLPRAGNSKLTFAKFSTVATPMRLWDEANGPTILKVDLLLYWLYANRDAYEATVKKFSKLSSTSISYRQLTRTLTFEKFWTVAMPIRLDLMRCSSLKKVSWRYQKHVCTLHENMRTHTSYICILTNMYFV